MASGVTLPWVRRAEQAGRAARLSCHRLNDRPFDWPYGVDEAVAPTLTRTAAAWTDRLFGASGWATDDTCRLACDACGLVVERWIESRGHIRCRHCFRAWLVRHRLPIRRVRRLPHPWHPWPGTGGAAHSTRTGGRSMSMKSALPLLIVVGGLIGWSITEVTSGRVAQRRQSPFQSKLPRPDTPPGAAVPPTPAPEAPEYDLVLVAKNGREEHGYHMVEGQVRNVSGKPLDHVVAVVEFYTQSGTFVKSEKASIEYQPLLPGQTSPFRVVATVNPAVSTYTVSFKGLFGGTFTVHDQLRTPAP